MIPFRRIRDLPVRGAGCGTMGDGRRTSKSLRRKLIHVQECAGTKPESSGNQRLGSGRSWQVCNAPSCFGLQPGTSMQSQHLNAVVVGAGPGIAAGNASDEQLAKTQVITRPSCFGFAHEARSCQLSASRLVNRFQRCRQGVSFSQVELNRAPGNQVRYGSSGTQRVSIATRDTVALTARAECSLRQSAQ